jgi:Peptidase family S41
MRKLAPALLALTISCSSAGQPLPTASAPITTNAAPTTTTTTLVSGRLLTNEEWRQDLEFLVARFDDVHPNALWRIGEANLTQMVSEIDAAIPDSTDDEILLDLTRLTATIDGHTQMFPLFQRNFERHMLPIQLYLFDDGVHVVGASSDYADLIGSEVIAIGSVQASEAIDLVLPFLQYDNPQTKRLLAPLLLVAPEILATLGVDEPEYLTVRGADGVEQRRRIEPIEDDGFAPAIPGNFGVGLPQREELDYLRHRDLAFWSTVFADSNTAYVQYNFVQGSSPTPEGSSQTLEQMLEGLDAEMAGSPADRFVIDLRHNPGGNNFTYGPLLAWVQERSPELPVYVITGRNTFSAAMNLATEIEQTTEATFVGEETGGSPNLYGDVRTVLLPNSNLAASISTVYWEKSTPNDTRPSIIPDLVVPVTAADYFGGRDAALEAIVAG